MLRRGALVILAVSTVLAACGPSAQEQAAAQVDLIFVSLDVGNLENAESALNEAVRLSPADVPAEARRAVEQRREALTTFLLAQDRFERSEYAGAVESFRLAAQQDHWFEDAARKGAAAASAAGALFVEREVAGIGQLLDDGDLEAAVSRFQEAQALLPEDPDLNQLAERVLAEYEAVKTEEIGQLLRSGDASQARQMILDVGQRLGGSTESLDSLLASAEDALAEAAAARQAALEAERAVRERLRRDVARRIGCESSNIRSVAHCDGFRFERVARTDLGDRWPLTVAAGTVICSSQGSRQIATFLPEASTREYALNGTADSMGWPSIRPIWADDDRPGFRGQGIKKSIGPIISAALALC